MGCEGEDVVADDAGGLKLACPARFQPGTMKAAAWQVRRWQRAGPHAPSLRHGMTQRMPCKPVQSLSLLAKGQCGEPALTRVHFRASASCTRTASFLR